MAKVQGSDVYSAIGVDPVQQTISSGPNQGQAYYRARHDGKGFIVNEQFYEDWTEGNIAELSLAPSKYFVDDPQNPGQQIERESWQLVGYATVEQMEKVVANEEKLNTIRHNAATDRKLASINKASELKLSDERMAALLDAI